MGMTLDDYLTEVDRWKQAASDRLAQASPAERARIYAESQAWLESKIGRPLRQTPPAATAPSP